LANESNSRGSADQSLPFEKPLNELEARIRETEDAKERKKLEGQLGKAREKAFSELTAWDRVMLARHAHRPRMLDFTTRILDDLVELHGDRALGDDPAMVCGIGRFRGQTVAVLGQQKGVSTEEKVRRNFGMAHPEGYRKALRVAEMAERLHLPIVTFVDTPAAHPGVEAEQHGQGPAIARNLWRLARINTPVYCAVLGEGGSGGALGIAVGDRVAMFEHAVYVICPPERCAEILWRDAEKKELAASAWGVTGTDLQRLGVIDAVLEEPPGGAHKNPSLAAATLADDIATFLESCAQGGWSVEQRRRKFRAMGQWSSVAPEGDARATGSGG
jgi:acetyl-CoA carboxylase carboxyl transferase subunit alpha